MPRPIAAGVFGMARTTLPPQTASSTAIVVPAMIETTRVDEPTNGRSAGPAVAKHLRLDRDHERRDGADILRCGIEPHALRGQRANLVGGMRLDYRDARGIESLREPAGQQRAAHLARAGEHDGAGDVCERFLRVRWSSTYSRQRSSSHIRGVMAGLVPAIHRLVWHKIC